MSTLRRDQVFFIVRASARDAARPHAGAATRVGQKPAVPPTQSTSSISEAVIME